MAAFFIDKPAATGGTIKGTGSNADNDYPAYQTADGRLLRWSAPFPLPEIGERIYITMNNIGWAVVQGYFEDESYLGVMTKAIRPPKWLRKQNQRDANDETKPEWYRRGIGCEFGAEIALKRPEQNSPQAV